MSFATELHLSCLYISTQLLTDSALGLIVFPLAGFSRVPSVLLSTELKSKLFQFLSKYADWKFFKMELGIT